MVHIKPVGDGEKALEYMGKYLFRVAITNNRIIKLENGKVTFRYTDSKTEKTKIVTLEVLEFIRRFLQHVLPQNFIKVRYYGYLAGASRKKLAKLRKMFYLDAIPENKQEKDHQLLKTLLCPICGSVLEWVEKLPKGLKDHVP